MIEPAPDTPNQCDRVMSEQDMDPIASIIPNRVYKKTSPNNKMTIYLINRDLAINGNKVEPLFGVMLLDPEYIKDRKLFGQLTLTFRYGREDEEVMGLKFCNEAILCLEQIYPPWLPEKERAKRTIPVQEALIRRLGPNSYPFTLEVACLAPPSVQLIPAKEYRGAPIGTSYEVRAYVAERPEERGHKRSSVRMSLRLVQYAPGSTPEDSQPQEPPTASLEKPFLLSDGRVELEATLDRHMYFHGDPVTVRVRIINRSNKTVRRIKVFIVQHVDVCMFSNGKFKNVVAQVESQERCPVTPGSSLERSFNLYPIKGVTKNWVAVEDSYFKEGGGLASSVPRPNGGDDRNVFAIYVTYYVKVKIILGAMGGVLAVKLPFSLMHPYPEDDPLSRELGIEQGEVMQENQTEQDGGAEELDKMAATTETTATNGVVENHTSEEIVRVEPLPSHLRDLVDTAVEAESSSTQQEQSSGDNAET